MDSYSRSSHSNGSPLKKIALVLGVLLSLVVLFTAVKIRTVEADEVGVLETWGGVEQTPLTPKTYFFVPGFGKTVHTYKTLGRVFVMNDKPESEESFGDGRRFDVLTVNSLDNQKVEFHIAVTWRIDPTKAVIFHQSYRDNVEESLIRPEVVNAVSIRATLKNAIDLYSGQSLNELRDVINTELRNPEGKLARFGVMVDLFVIEKPKLNPEYERVIEARQLAIATESQAREQEKANVAIANASKAAALKQQFEDVVKAETAAKKTVIDQQAASDKAIIETAANAKNTIVTQQAEAERITLAAKAERDRNVLIAEGEREAALSRAQAIEAIGKAEAESKKLALAAYNVDGAEAFVKIEVAKYFSQGVSGIKGYLPEGMNVNLLSSDYTKGVNLLVGGTSTEASNK